ncbi:methyltransferase domain-containing protein [Nevskia sp.]|uniref:class I SAM-dependent methyltransferase n=1 Tax=Nevskia sp. TaxID=1929292 RepID=UPI0025D2AF41|nr:methyltransferase domain-containing protein [Nevskia sp.]
MPNRLAVSGGQPFNRQALKTWLASPRGKRLLALEERELSRVLPNLFGRHCLQIGNWGDGQLLASADMLHRAVLGTLIDSLGDAQAVTQPDALPIMERSVDAVLLPHTLEFSPSPHNLLREVNRILSDRGRLMILGFNPWSLWGLRRVLGMGTRAFPTGARFHSAGRLADWLELLDFEITELRRFGVGFPWTEARTSGEPFTVASLAMPLAEGYLIVAKKRVIPMSMVTRLPRAQVKQLVGRALGGIAATPAVTPDLNTPAE